MSELEQMLTRDDIKTATGLYATLTDLRAAREAGEGYYGSISLVATDSRKRTFLTVIEKERGVQILNDMIEVAEGKLSALGFDPKD